jgi:hypothetical protein
MIRQDDDTALRLLLRGKGRRDGAVGSASGTAPGITVAGVALPLNPDPYLVSTIALANQGPFVATLGALDADGRAAAALVLPSGAGPTLVGLELHHAAGLFAPPAFGLVTATDPARLAFVP